MAGRFVKRYSDIVLAALVVGIVGMMIIPLPTWLLDILLATNIALAVVLLLVSIYVSNPLRIATFPTILLITTLFRLGLNVSSTRLILVQADAGEVIRSFGDFVVAGNVVVGVIVFLILTLIQFVVIARGSERVAEVAARFTLDAMPGKQMSIDADLRAGQIDQAEARRRRQALERESQLYGSMDGAMKFVKGDAIAGIAITLINIVGGLVVGIWQVGMEVGVAVETYSLLTIGDGLVTQIPALIISTAAGLIITRVASEDERTHLGEEIGTQLLRQPKAIAIAALLMLALALVPGLPFVPFLVLGALCGAAAYTLLQRRALPLAAVPGADDIAFGLAAVPDPGGGEPASARAGPTRALVEPITVLLSPALSDWLAPPDADDAGPGLEVARLPEVRARIFRDLGVALPPIRVRPGAARAPAGGYRILLKEIPFGEAVVRPAAPEGGPDRPDEPALALAAAPYLQGLGVAGAEPAALGGIPAAAWIPAAEVDAARAHGVVVRRGEAILVTHLEALLRRYAYEFVDVQQARRLLDTLATTHPELVAELVPKPIGVPLLAEVLRRLVAEGINVRHLGDILPVLARRVETERDPDQLAELCRAELWRQITHQLTAGSGELAVVLVDPEVEETVAESMQRSAAGRYRALEPELEAEIVEAAKRATADALAAGRPAVVLTSAAARRPLRGLLEVALPSVVVLSHEDVAPDLRIRRVATIEAGR